MKIPANGAFRYRKNAVRLLLLVLAVSVFTYSPPKAEAFSFSSLFSSVSSFFKPSQTPEQIDQKQIQDLISHSYNIAGQLSSRLDTLQGITSTLSQKISDMSAENIDVSDVWPYFNDATSTIAAARVTIAQATSTLQDANQNVSTVNLETLNNSLKNTFQTAQDQINAIHVDLLNATKALQNDLQNGQNQQAQSSNQSNSTGQNQTPQQTTIATSTATSNPTK